MCSPVKTVLLLLPVFMFSGCNSQPEKKVQPVADTIPAKSLKDKSIPGNFSTQTLLTFDSSQLAVFLEKYPLFTGFKTNLVSFYRNRKYAYAWFDEKGLIEQAVNLHNRINNITDEGLPAHIPYRKEFTELVETGNADSTVNPPVFTELMLSAQYFFYATNVWGGLNEKQTNDLNWYLPRKKVSYTQLLDSLINGKELLDAAPVFRQYELLKQELKKYNAILKQGGFPAIPQDKKAYKKGDSSAAIAAIRKVLFLYGDIAADNSSAVFDDELLQGILLFQKQVGDKPDGIIGAVLLKELQTPVENRIEQIAVNMERSRWVPVNIRRNYIVVNIPEYRLHLYEDDSLVWSMNVVVGAVAHKTAIFNGDMKYVVFSPYWNVPLGILRKEVLPGIKKSPNYLASHNMEWNGGNVRQKPGPNNSLGLVKFLFPNSFDIYLHDTPSKSLFGENKRAFSHGCIRLAEPQKLAEYLLRNDAAWNRDKIVAAMNAGKEKYVTLNTTMPVFIAYFTSWVDRQGKINFRHDVYGRDSRLAKMILEKPAY